MSIVYLGKATPASGSGGGSITVDQTYDATSTNAQSGTAVAEALTTITAFTGATSSVAGNAGLVPAPTTSDVDKYLKGDGTWAAVSGLQNAATQSSSLSITEAITGVGSVNFGTMYNSSSSKKYDSTVSMGVGTYTGGVGDVVIGSSARAFGAYSVAIGLSAYTRQNYSIQLGFGENNEAKSFYVGFYDTNSSLRNNYKLLDGTTGKIPSDRISIDGTSITINGNGQLQASGGGGSGIQNTATGSDSLTILGTPATDDISVNIGVDSSVNSYGAIAIGYAAEADEWGVAIGGYDDNASSGTYAYPRCVAIGCNTKAGSAEGEEAIAIRGVADSGSIAIGGGAEGINSIALGEYSDVRQSGGNSATGSIAIGYRTEVIGDYSIALGTYATTSSSYEFVVGGYDSNRNEAQTFKLMDLQTGKIPNDRINGVSGSFTLQDGTTITVTNGIITHIVNGDDGL